MLVPAPCVYDSGRISNQQPDLGPVPAFTSIKAWKPGRVDLHYTCAVVHGVHWSTCLLSIFSFLSLIALKDETPLATSNSKQILFCIPCESGDVVCRAWLELSMIPSIFSMAPTSSISRGSDTLDVFTRRSQPKIEIELIGQKPGLVNSYTTGDQIEGTAIVTVEHETRFDEVEIILQGAQPSPHDDPCNL